MKQTNRFVNRRLRWLFPLCAVLGCLVGLSLQAAPISVTAGGVGPFTFDTVASTNGWNTRSLAGGGGDINDSDALDAAVQAITAASVNSLLVVSTAADPGNNGLGQYSSVNRNILTRTTGVIATILMATLRNETGANSSSVQIRYDLGTSGAVTVEQVPSHQVYYSLTGAAGDWVKVPSISGAEAGAVIGTITLSSPWVAGTDLYLIWVDDNANPGTDDAWTIDNLALNAGGSIQPVAITTQPVASTNAAERSNLTLSVTATGSSPSYQWFKDSAAIAGETGRFLVLTNVTPGAAGVYRVVVSNSVSQVTSTDANVTVTPDTVRPRVIVAYVNEALTQWTLVFSEPVTQLSAEDTSNYYFESTDGTVGQFATAASLVNPSNVVVTTPAGTAGLNYRMVLGEPGFDTTISDRAATPNFILGVSMPVQQFLPQPVIDTDPSHMWTYIQNTNDLTGTGWQNFGYNDSTWNVGANGFATPTGEATPFGLVINTTANLNTPTVANGLTTYFRTHFTFTGTNTAALLELTTAIDDGAVIYLNGQEITRVRLEPGPVNYNTLVAAAQGEPIPGDIIYVLAQNLIRGTNLLAVEVHQAGTGSSDLLLAMRIKVGSPVLPSGPPVFVGQPVGATIDEGQSHTFSVDVTGAFPFTYQWLMGGSEIPGATGATYTVTNAPPSAAGAYSVRVTNSAGNNTSAAATLTVRADTTAPRLLSGNGGTNLSQITLTFSEGLNEASAINPANYQVFNSSGGVVAVQSVSLTNGSNVVITLTAPRVANQFYRVVVNNVRDLSTAGNSVAANSEVTISYTVSLIALSDSHVWSYNQTGTDLGTAWREVGYNDSTWTNGMALFDVVRDSTRTEVDGIPVRTVLSLTNNSGTTNITVYFRTKFNFSPASTSGVTLNLTHVIDDGAVVYLNGSEIYRFNMGTNAVSYTNFAVSVGTASRQGPFQIPLGTLQTGTNVLAVEVHQTSLGSSDLTFGLELNAFFNSGSGGAPTVRQSYNRSTGRMTISWDGTSCLQETTALQGAATVWTTSAVQNGVAFTPSGTQKFYRLSSVCQ